LSQRAAGQPLPNPAGRPGRHGRLYVFGVVSFADVRVSSIVKIACTTQILRVVVAMSFIRR
jgi:hypothetical protein